MEVDGRPRLRRTSHGMGHGISPPHDCDLTVFPAIASFWQRQPRDRPLKDNRHENIKWDPWKKDSPERQKAKRCGGPSTRRRQRAGVSLRGDLCYDSWSLSPLGYLYPGTTPVMIKLDHDRSCPWVVKYPRWLRLQLSYQCRARDWSVPNKDA